MVEEAIVFVGSVGCSSTKCFAKKKNPRPSGRGFAKQK
jgi:hypothetical protein